MTIKPIVTMIFADGKKRKLEMYDRPEIVTLRLIGTDGSKVEVPFVRFGPDEYKQMVKKEVNMKDFDRKGKVERVPMVTIK